MKTAFQFALRTFAIAGMALSVTCAQAAPLEYSTSPGLGTLLTAWWLQLMG